MKKKPVIRGIALIILTLFLPFTQSAKAQAASHFPPPFGGEEIYFTEMSPLRKWNDLLGRLDAQKDVPPEWREDRKLSALSQMELAREVNQFVNRYPYFDDRILWGVADYWAIPPEFFAKGGDCEDYAIAKYAWLRYLGVPENQLRIAIVHDRIQRIAHAITLFYVEGQPMILDNQARDIRNSRDVSRYKMIYSMNRTGWWAPRKEQRQQFSSAEMPDAEIQPAAGEVAPTVPLCENGLPLSACLNRINPSAP